MYSTKQKSSIINLLKENSDKLLSPDKISDLLKERNEAVGKATLYRYFSNIMK